MKDYCDDGYDDGSDDEYCCISYFVLLLSGLTNQLNCTGMNGRQYKYVKYVVCVC